MSLAMYAAPFDNEISNNNKSSQNNKSSHNKTQRIYPKDNNKVNTVLEEIHNNSSEDDENYLGDFNPPPIPDSAGVSKTIATEQTMHLTKNKNIEMMSMMGNTPQPNTPTDDGYFLNSYNNNNQTNQKSVDEYYKKIIPDYDSNRQNINKQYYSNATSYDNQPTNNQDVLLQKLNYMIHLLEEKKDEKTNNVMEEVILYSFLGIFIIFVVDSFARVGKYVR